MSRILRYEEITAQQPTPDSFTQGIDTVRSTLTDLHKQDEIEGAMLYGSAVVGDPNPQSDIDLLIVTSQKSARFTEKVRSMTLGTYNSTGIPMDVNCYSPEELASGNHYYQENLISFLRRHAETHPQSIIGSSPLHIIRPPQNRGVIQYVDNYFSNRADELERTYINGYVSNPEGTLETVLNLPHRLGRLSISALQTKGYVPTDTIQSTNKSHIKDVVMQTLGSSDPTIGDLYEEIYADYRLYPSLVQEVTEKNLTIAEYGQILSATLAANLPRAILLARRMQVAYRSYLPEAAGS